MTYPPKIKKSHRGLLHKDLGIPMGQKIGEARLEEAKHSRNPAVRKRANFALNFNDHGVHGHVVAIRAHHSRPDYMNLEVAHGKRSRSKGPEGSVSSYDDRPTSSLVIPRHMAKHYRIGQRVGVGAVPMQGAENDDMDMDAGHEPDMDGDDIGAMKDKVVRGLAHGRGATSRKSRGY